MQILQRFETLAENCRQLDVVENNLEINVGNLLVERDTARRQVTDGQNSCITHRAQIQRLQEKIKAVAEQYRNLEISKPRLEKTPLTNCCKAW